MTAIVIPIESEGLLSTGYTIIVSPHSSLRAASNKIITNIFETNLLKSTKIKEILGGGSKYTIYGHGQILFILG